MRYPHRYTIFVPAASVPAAQELFVLLGGESQRNVLDASGFSENGEAPATHFAASTVATEAQRLKLEQLEEASHLPDGLIYFRTSNDEASILLNTNHEDAETHLGASWLVSDSAIAMNLKPVEVSNEQ